MKYDYDLLVVGSGPGGHRAAIAAAKLGHRVAIVDRKQMIGGVCINTGTIPSKTLREAVLYLTGMQQRELYGASYRATNKLRALDRFGGVACRLLRHPGGRRDLSVTGAVPHPVGVSASSTSDCVSTGTRPQTRGFGTSSPARTGPGGVPSPNGRPPRASRPWGVSQPDRSGPSGTMPSGFRSVCTM